MKIGCCVIPDEVEIAALAGFDYIELPGALIAQMDHVEFSFLLEKIKQLRIPCTGFNAALPEQIKICGPNYNPQKSTDYIRLLCERAAALGIQRIGVGSPKSRPDVEVFPEEIAWQEALEFMRVFCRTAEPYGVQILWETLSAGEANFGISMKTGANRLVIPLQREGICNVGLLVDLFHMRKNMEGHAELRELLSLIKHAHISGNKSEERGFPDVFCAEQFAEVFNLLRETECTLSIEALEGDPVENAAASLAALREKLA